MSSYDWIDVTWLDASKKVILVMVEVLDELVVLYHEFEFMILNSRLV